MVNQFQFFLINLAPILFFFGVIFQMIGTLFLARKPDFYFKDKNEDLSTGIIYIVCGFILISISFFIQNYVGVRMGIWVITPEEIFAL